MVCCITNRPLVYYTFGDKDFVEDFNHFYQFLVEQQITIGMIMKITVDRKNDLYSNL